MVEIEPPIRAPGVCLRMAQTVLPHLCRTTIDQLFSRPRVLVQFLDACLNLESHQQILNILQQDAALSVRVLQASVSSSCEPLPAEHPLASAVKRLSDEALAAIALCAASRCLGERPGLPQSRFRQSLWFQSRAAGITARCLAEAISYPCVEEAQLAGMLHNIGMQMLFAQDSSHYHEKVYHPTSSIAVCDNERNAYGCDHLQLAEELVSGWHLESVLADALRFLHHPQAEGSGTLIRLLQLTHAICVSPAHLSREALDLAQRHFDLAPAAMQDIFDWIERHYRSFSEYGGNPDLLRREELEAVQQLQTKVFQLAERQAKLAQIGRCESLEQLLGTGRCLLLQSLAGREVIFLQVDADKGVFCGLPVPGQSQLIADLRVPCDPAISLIARCLSEDGPQDSGSIAANEISVADRSLLRLTSSPRFVCFPLEVETRLSAVAISLDSGQDIDAYVVSETAILCQALARRLLNCLQPRTQSAKQDAKKIEMRRVAHEINNPLAVLGNYVQVLRQQQADSEVLTAMEREVQRVTEILSYYRRQQEQSLLPEAPVDLKALMKSVLASLRSTLLQPRQIEVVMNCGQISPFSSKSIVLRQILINLIKNSAEALPPGGRIELQGRDLIEDDGKRQVEIVVTDNGPGIAPHLLEQIFSPVISTKGSEHEGLGLNIVHNMAGDIDAHISCQRSDECGTSFRILIACSTDEKKAISMKGSSQK